LIPLFTPLSVLEFDDYAHGQGLAPEAAEDRLARLLTRTKYAHDAQATIIVDHAHSAPSRSNL
jgi:hypothetical protein